MDLSFQDVIGAIGGNTASRAKIAGAVAVGTAALDNELARKAGALGGSLGALVGGKFVSALSTGAAQTQTVQNQKLASDVVSAAWPAVKAWLSSWGVYIAAGAGIVWYLVRRR